MANLLLIIAPDTATMTKERSFLTADVAKNATSLPVENTAGFVNTDIIAVGSLYTESCEANALTGSPQAGALPVTALALGHKRGAPVSVLNYNRFKIYTDTSPTGTFTTEITAGGVSLDMDQQEFYYRDSTGTSATWYKVTWVNSLTTQESDKSLSIPFQPSRYSCIDPVVLRQDYLMGVRLTDFYGNPLRDSTLLRHMYRNLAHMETYLGTVIYAQDIVGEHHDYYQQDYMSWGFLKVNKHPVISVTKLSIQFPENQELIDFPLEWVQVDSVPGQINLIPTAGTVAGYLLMRSPVAPLMMARMENVPHIWRINYRAGFEYNAIPHDIEDILYKMSAVSILGILGDTVFGPGIASRSLSIDGLSQSVGTVASSVYNIFSARMNQFNQDIQTYLPQLKKRYQGIRMSVL
jgi:hypothetical protein